MTEFTEITSGLRFPEGPIAMPDGSVILVEMFGPRITRVHPDGTKETVADIVGGILWGGGMTFLGYFLGNVPFVKNHLELMILLIVFLSILPGLTAVGRNVLRRRGALPQDDGS